MLIKSANILSANYDRKEHRLNLRFRKRPDSIYEYMNVPPSVWTKFLVAQSKGAYFAEYIKYVYAFQQTFIERGGTHNNKKTSNRKKITKR